MAEPIRAEPGFARRSSDVVRSHGSRWMLRSGALTALAAAHRLTGHTERMLRRPRVHVVLLHHLFDDEVKSFRKLLSSLAQTHTFISYGEAVRRAHQAGEAIDRPYLAFTFDDGFKNCLRAADVLGEFAVVACHFVCPGIIGERDPGRIAAFCTKRLELPRPVEFMDWRDLERLRDAGHEIGGHTMSHARLSELSGAALDDEIAGSFDAIAARLGRPEHFAWTYGRFGNCSAEAVRRVFAAGYRTCASGERGCHGPNRADASAPLCIRREHLIAGQPLQHTLYFLQRSSDAMTPASGAWPAGWAVETRGRRA